MSAASEGADDLRRLVAAALGHARTVRSQLLETAIPALPPARRSFAEWLVRKLAQGAFFDEPTSRDIDAFIDFVEHQVEAGTHLGWEADEHHVRGGYDVVYLDARAKALSPVLADLRKLQAAIARVLDEARAATVAADLAAG